MPTCESWSCLLTAVPGLAPVWRLGNRGLGIHMHARERRESERSDMADPRVETPSLSDHTEFTETKVQGPEYHATTRQVLTAVTRMRCICTVSVHTQLLRLGSCMSLSSPWSPSLVGLLVS